jgi:hypothetical protein
VALGHWLVVTNLWSLSFTATAVTYPTFKKSGPRDLDFHWQKMIWMRTPSLAWLRTWKKEDEV